MTGHELARDLLALPDLPVVINGWGSGEGSCWEVTSAGEPVEFPFVPADGNEDERWNGGSKPCIALNHYGAD